MYNISLLRLQLQFKLNGGSPNKKIAKQNNTLQISRLLRLIIITQADMVNGYDDEMTVMCSLALW